MGEPTYRQHRLLESIHETGAAMRNSGDEDIEQLWALVRGGYLKNFVSFGAYDWIFKLSDKAREYFDGIKTLGGE